jgi:hypothetical protein
MKRFHVTYDIVTPESAEHGDTADHGFVLPGGWKHSCAAGPVGEAFIPVKNECAMSLREAFDLIDTGALEDNGAWLSECDGRMDYRTGAEERRAFHPPDNCTAASKGRLWKLFGVK